MVTQEELQKEAPLFLRHILQLKPVQLPQDYFSQAHLVAAYIVGYCKIRYGKKYRGGPLRWPELFSVTDYEQCLKLGPKANLTYQQAEENFISLQQQGYFKDAAAFHLRSIPLSATRSLVCWALGFFPLHLHFDVPTPAEVMAYQSRGQRLVSLIFKGDEFVEGGRDPLGFALHDLIHADHFYKDRLMAQGQIGFNQWVNRLYHQGDFNLLLESPHFRDEFYYTVSDMNAHCVHLLKCLKANVLNWYLRDENKNLGEQLSQTAKERYQSYWQQLFRRDSPDIQRHVQLLNCDEGQLELSSIEEYFIQVGSVDSP